MMVPNAHGPTPLIFSGSRRSGTTWLAGMLNAHWQIECRNEGWLFNDLIGPTGSACFSEWLDQERVRTWASHKEAQGTWMQDSSFDQFLLTLRRSMWFGLMHDAVKRQAWKDWNKLAYVGDKTTQHYLSNIDAVHAILPDAKFLHMLRDGRDVVVSDMFLLIRELETRKVPAPVRAHALRAQAEFVPEINRRRTKSIEADVIGAGSELQPVPARPGSMASAVEVPLLDQACMRLLTEEWCRAVAGSRRARELYGPNYHEIRYEDMIARPKDTLRGVLEWLGVESTDANLERLLDLGKFERHSGGRLPGQGDNGAEWRKGIVGDWRNYFGPEQRQAFKAIAGELLVELGYAQNLDW